MPLARKALLDDIKVVKQAYLEISGVEEEAFGVELGQVAFVMLVILLERSFRTLEIHWPRWVEMAPGYTVGSLGAYWTIQRAVILVRGLL